MAVDESDSRALSRWSAVRDPREVGFDPLGISAYVAPAYARYRADVDTTTAVGLGDTHQHVILKAEPKGCRGRLDALVGRHGCDNLPSHVARSGQGARKGLQRRSLEREGTKVWVTRALLGRDLRAAVLSGIGCIRP